MENQGILAAIELMGKINDGKGDKETHKLVKQIISSMENKNRTEWPSKELRTIVNKMDHLQYSLFLLTLKDMDEGLTEYFSK